jgi:NarL family two-component system response regulator LiaR
MSEMSRIKVMLVDDHDMVRQGLAIFIETVDDLELVAQASNGVQAIQLCDQLVPDVILMDLMMPEMDGFEASQAILAAHPDIRIVALTSFKDKKLVQSALQAGAMSYVLKNATIDELADVIRAAYAGKPVLSMEATQVLIEMAANPPQDFNLTERELEILAWLAKGLTNRQIAEHMFLSRFTVKSYVSDILSKLGASSRSEAVALALQNNLIE